MKWSKKRWSVEIDDAENVNTTIFCYASKCQLSPFCGVDFLVRFCRLDFFLSTRRYNNRVLILRIILINILKNTFEIFRDYSAHVQSFVSTGHWAA